MQVPDMVDPEEQEGPEDACPKARLMRPGHLPHEPVAADAGEIVGEEDEQVVAEPRAVRGGPHQLDS